MHGRTTTVSNDNIFKSSYKLCWSNTWWKTSQTVCAAGQTSMTLSWLQITMTWVQVMHWSDIIIISLTATNLSTWRWANLASHHRALRSATTAAHPLTPQVCPSETPQVIHSYKHTHLKVTYRAHCILRIHIHLHMHFAIFGLRSLRAYIALTLGRAVSLPINYMCEIL